MSAPQTFEVPEGTPYEIDAVLLERLGAGVFFWPDTTPLVLHDPMLLMHQYADQGVPLLYRAQQVSRMTIGLLPNHTADTCLLAWMARARANAEQIIEQNRPRIVRQHRG